MKPLLLCSLGLLLSASITHAESLRPGESLPLYLWSFQRGCSPDPALADAVQATIQRMAYPVQKLNPPPAWAGCEGTACIQRLQRQCDALPTLGAVLGGQGEQRGAYTVYSMWLVDLATGKTAYLDHYCKGCDLAAKLADGAAAFIERPMFGPHAPPPYCAAGRTSRPAALPAVTKVHFVAYGEGRHKTAIAATIESIVAGTGMRAEPVTLHSKDYNTPEITRRIAPNGQAEQIVLADVHADGAIDLHLYDARLQTSDYLAIECPACDKEQVIAKVQHGVTVLLDRCRGDACGLPAERAPAPAEVCQPMMQCAAPLAMFSPGDATATSSSDAARMPRVFTGLAWGMVGVSAATSALLLGLNASSSTESPNTRADNLLLGPAITAAGCTVLSLGLAVPLTLHSRRASPSKRTASQAFVCPQPSRRMEPAK